MHKKYLIGRAVSVIIITLLFVSGCKQESNSQVSNQTETINQPNKLLAFSKTTGWRHDSIAAGIKAIHQIGEAQNYQVLATEDAAIFNDRDLSKFSALIFLNTTGDVLNDEQQVAMERYIQAGGGFVGIHSAADTEHAGDWYWYRKLVGGVFKSHPNIPSNVQLAELTVVDDKHQATHFMPSQFQYADEWYDYKDLSKFRNDLLSLDEDSYQGGLSGHYHPIAWYQEFDGGRSFYTGIGHTADNFTNPFYLEHLLGGIKYAIGDNVQLDYSKSKPEHNRFVKEVHLEGLNEPVSFSMTNDAKTILYIERKGGIFQYNLQDKSVINLGSVPVYSGKKNSEFGLIAIALDPNFDQNQQVYLMYNKVLEQDKLVQSISRFKLSNQKIDLSSEQVLLTIPSDNTCCHTGGNMEFNQAGELFIAVGDNTNPFNSDGLGPTNNKAEEAVNDALRTSANTMDLRGKILRIVPNSDTGYSIPKGNLFTDAEQGRAEIYVMGTRNPYTISYDEASKALYFGDVGPDAKADDPKKGPMGYDEINKVTQAGNFGWPMFIANNQAYRDYDETNDKLKAWYNPLDPINNSPRNTGSHKLPPAQPALIYYPYGNSEKFKALGAGSRNALVAGVYRQPTSTEAGIKSYPKYYDGKLFISDFMRRWLKVVTTNSAGKVIKIDNFAPQLELAAPIDLSFSANGELWVLEYGSKWFKGNDDAKLSRIVYTGDGNREPIANIQLKHSQGAAPLLISADASLSKDLDGDALTYGWSLQALSAEQVKLGQILDSVAFNPEKVISNQAVLSTQIHQPGQYALILKVTDSQGADAYSKKLIEVGNDVPDISISISGNQSFVWPNEAKAYQVVVTDKEDGSTENASITADAVNVLVRKQQLNKVKLGHQIPSDNQMGKDAVKQYNCLGCHQLKSASIGPSFNQIADKYTQQAQANTIISQSIAQGSRGKWGDHQMPAHNFLNSETRQAIAQYILSFTSPDPSLPLTGQFKVTQPADYKLMVEYTDKGANNLAGITAKAEYLLRSPILRLSDLVNRQHPAKSVRVNDDASVKFIGEASYLYLGKYDLTQINSIKLTHKINQSYQQKSKFEIRVDSINGDLIGQGQFNLSAADSSKQSIHTSKITPLNQTRELYLLVNSKADDNLVKPIQIIYMEFSQ
ncbi:ThuA domain-containing protein [Catenovulum maritimum]|uniref:ThuA domain-containing protein n=1 Tax=Catenovulum maritimum TaxID=1513271 RepID=UPI00069ECC84|nr:ThuA domain-containing protein [Catenovulum maritimum]